MSSFSKWDRDAYRKRVGADEAARRRGAIMAEQWGYQLAEEASSNYWPTSVDTC
ncbi:hypothetical protein [Nocardia miyunensis]|uniref:hypothetical protein n=1 Tax=Nocardia miyunensis TaxID=282684 RepID=UPI000A80C162|nr:hypothetical protein [Nocardia miyunensis]